MKKESLRTLAVLLLYFIFAFTGCVPSASEKCATYRKSIEYNMSEVDAFISTMDEQFNSLGFKGIHLEMGYDQLNEVIKKTPWGYKYRNLSDTPGICENWYDFPQYKQTNFLRGDDSTKGATWAKIGCYGPNGKGSCNWIDYVFVQFFDDKLVEISLSSPGWSADKINSMLKSWGEFALGGLSKKYGKPTVIYTTFDEMNIFSFKSGFKKTLYKWNLGKEEIKITITEYESKFSCNINFQNKKGINELSKMKSKGKSEF